MNPQLPEARSEATIWAQLIDSQPKELTREAAQYLLAVQFSQSDQTRLQELAERSQAGTLTEDESREFDSYLHVGNLLAVMQSKARAVLNNPSSQHPRS